MLYRQRGADWAKIAGSTYKASSLKPVKDNQSQSQATRRLTKTQALERIFLSVFYFLCRVCKTDRITLLDIE